MQHANSDLSKFIPHKNSTGDAFAREILSQICGRNLYIKAKINVSNLIKILRENGANLDVIDGYENLPCANIKLRKTCDKIQF